MSQIHFAYFVFGPALLIAGVELLLRDGATLVGIGVIIVALAAAYWVIRRARG